MYVFYFTERVVIRNYKRVFQRTYKKCMYKRTGDNCLVFFKGRPFIRGGV